MTLLNMFRHNVTGAILYLKSFIHLMRNKVDNTIIIMESYVLYSIAGIRPTISQEKETKK